MKSYKYFLVKYHGTTARYLSQATFNTPLKAIQQALEDLVASHSVDSKSCDYDTMLIYNCDTLEVVSRLHIAGFIFKRQSLQFLQAYVD